jgi:flagellar biosynthesis/type III secretory pathway M-ring protein FliF/YscJ
MIALALILLVLVAVLVVAIVVSNPEIYDLSIFHAVIPVNSAGIFITGAIAMAVTILALLLLRIGVRRARLRHRRLKALEAPNEEAASEVTDAETESPERRPPAAVHADREESSASTTSRTAAPTRAGEPEAPREKSALDLDSQSSTTTAAERRAMLEEADELTRDDPQK